jgi:hypothetical protein
MTFGVKKTSRLDYLHPISIQQSNLLLPIFCKTVQIQNNSIELLVGPRELFKNTNSWFII